MSQLPEWLWPVEDEEAVQEAERLIEETHNSLRKMEADMQVQRSLSQHLLSKTDKLKSSMNNRIHSLEKELKNLSDPKDSASSCDKQPINDKLPSNKQFQKGCVDEQKLSAPKILAQTKVDSSFSASQQVCQSNRKPKSNSNSAEQVVMSAREKVQDALAMARHVSASLDQRVSTTLFPSKPLSISQVTNVGIFEVKSQAEEIKTQNPKPRLQQALLPSISIKRGLEKQSILSIQVPPGEKTVKPNISVYSIKHDKVTIPQDSAGQQKAYKENENASNDKENMKCTTGDLNLENTVAQLSKQLMEVEELREINQTQVNHVLRYLISRVCSGSQAQERTDTTHDESSNTKTKETAISPISSSTSASSKQPIAYDSLSRFLETYKKAAEHNMTARKRAAERRQREIMKQKKEIQQSQNLNDNHLLIGPLRQAVKLKESDVHMSMPEYHNATSGSYRGNGHEESKSGADITPQDVSLNEDIPSYKHSSDLLSPQEEGSKNNSPDISLPSLKMPSGGISYDEYEDDWEEEEDHNRLQHSGHKLDSDRKNNEQLHSLSDSDTSKPHEPALKSLEIEFISDLNLLSPSTSGKQKSPSVDEIPSRQEETVTVDNFRGVSQLSHNKNSVLSEELKELKQQLNKPGEHSDVKKSPQIERDVDSSPVFVQETRDPNTVKATNITLVKETEEKQPNDESRAKHSLGMRKRSQARLLSSCSSSSDAEINYEPRRPPRSFKRWDLKLREDLQLQSAILLNWQLENRWKSKNCESDSTKDQPTFIPHKDQIITDVEKRWQKTLDELDLRVKSIEENERINRIANEIKMQIREEHSKTDTQTNIYEDRRKAFTSEDKLPQPASKVVMMDQTVQTSPMKPVSQDKELPRKHNQVTVPSLSAPPMLHDFKTLSSLRRQLPSSVDNDDLTSELLAYGRMGILASGRSEMNLRKSPTSSSTSSHLHQSSTVLSLSDGELRSSASESCSCSEGEFCVCGGRKRCSQRAPPDGSQTLSDGEHFLRDISQGEIPPSKIKNILKDTSFGEITNHVTGDTPFEGLDLVEESIDSEDFEWDLR